MMDIEFVNALPETAYQLDTTYGLVVDAIFGFSFSGKPSLLLMTQMTITIQIIKLVSKSR